MKGIFAGLFFTLFCAVSFAQSEVQDPKEPLVLKKNGFVVSIRIDPAMTPEQAVFAGTVADKLREKVEKNPEEIECNTYFVVRQKIDEKTGKPKRSLEIGIGNRPDFHPSFLYSIYNLPSPAFTDADRTDNISRSLGQIEYVCPAK